jgi:hypothetical protein
VRAVAQLEKLNTTVVRVINDDVAVTADSDAIGMGKLPIAASLAADAANVRTVGVIQHLHAMIAAVNHHQMTGAIQRDAPRTLNWPSPAPLAPDGPQVLPVTTTASKHLLGCDCAALQARFRSRTSQFHDKLSLALLTLPHESTLRLPLPPFQPDIIVRL